MRCRTILRPFLASSVAAAAILPPTAEVPLLGPSFISNFDPTNSKAIKNATESFPDVLESLFKSEALNKTDLVFAVDVFSAATNESLYSYYHVGEGREKTLTAGKLNDTTISRTGSVSKLFTVYAILAQAGIEVFSHPVTRYIPELAGNSSGDPLKHVFWDDITIGALASQQAGSGGAGAVLALKPLNPQDITPDELFTYMRDIKHPVISPYRGAVYSDGGFAILTQVLARLTGRKYEDAIRELLFKPLGLDGMSATVPKGADINIINRTVVDVNSSWALDVPIVAGSGGIYASSADLRAAGLSILNSQLLSAATTRHWMKPLSGTGSLVELVGAPWEIQRLAIPVTIGQNRTRISDLYTKAGGNGDYTCIFALSPDHGIGYSLLVAGDTASSARWPLRNAVGELFISAAEGAAVENAKNSLAGTFVADKLEGSNLTLTVDDGHTGLGLDSIYVNGTEITSLILGLTEPTEVNVSARLYPTGPNSYSRSLSALYKTNGTMRVAHRAVVLPAPLEPRAVSEGGKGDLFDNQHSWMNIDFQSTLDEFIFTIEDGKLTSVENTGAEIVFKRVEE